MKFAVDGIVEMLGLRKVVQKAPTGCIAAFSTKPTFAKQRKNYKEELTVLRKGWQNEIEIAREREVRRLAAEKKQIVLEKAIRLRDKRKDSALRQEQDRLTKEAIAKNFRAHLARMQLIWKDQKRAAEVRQQKLAVDIDHEKSAWITERNLDDKICPELFRKQCTTGLVQRSSENWRYHVLSMNLTRMMTPEAQADFDGSLTSRLNLIGQTKLTKKMVVQDFLSDMVGTGEERAKFDQLVDEISPEIDDYDHELNTLMQEIVEMMGEEDDDEDDDLYVDRKVRFGAKDQAEDDDEDYDDDVDLAKFEREDSFDEREGEDRDPKLEKKKELKGKRDRKKK